jgi:glutathione synthase/RimK-type ligase-like ATP-grasp enzyme
VTGELTVGGKRYALEEFTAVYTRLMDHQSLPEVANEPQESPRRLLARDWHDAVLRWYEIAPIRVVNRTAPMGSNSSKPFQAQAVTRRGFFTPETLITNDPDLARAFIAEHRRVVFKSTSGIRSIVREVGEDDLRRLDAIRSCPVQFQAYVEGRNVRVHTVGDEVFATGISTEATDYRYAHRQRGEPAVLEAVEVSDDLAAQCRALARDLELPFAGLDLKITPADEVYCFEVNPSPAYSYYESHTGQPISAALARYLVGGASHS